jgi:DNA-binding XRE family transcriptional regulator
VTVARTRKEAPSEFGGRLRALREGRGLTQDQLAAAAGLHRFTIAKIEQGHREPNWPTVLKLAAALDVPCTAFTVPTGPAPALKAKGKQRPKGGA